MSTLNYTLEYTASDGKEVGTSFTFTYTTDGGFWNGNISSGPSRSNISGCEVTNVFVTPVGSGTNFKYTITGKITPTSTSFGCKISFSTSGSIVGDTHNLTITGVATEPVKYTITAKSNSSTYGTATVNGESQVTVAEGSSVTLKATPNGGYTFSKWNDGDTNATRTVTVSEDKTYTATFAVEKYTVTISKGTGCNYVSSSSKTNITYGTSISGTITDKKGTLKIGTSTITASPSPHYDMSSWSGIPSSGTITSNITVTANGTKRTARTFYVYAGAGGSVSPSSATVYDGDEGDEYGDEYTITDKNVITSDVAVFTATPDEGYEVDYWEHSSQTISSSSTSNTVYFKEQLTSLVINKGDYDSFKYNGTTYTSSSKTFSVSSGTSYNTSSKSGTASGTSVTVNPASLSIKQYSITYKYVINYMVDGELYYTQNSTVGPTVSTSAPSTSKTSTITLTATNPTKEGYEFTGWMNGSTLVGSSISMSNTTVTLTASFKKLGAIYVYDDNGVRRDVVEYYVYDNEGRPKPVQPFVCVEKQGGGIEWKEI